MKKESILSCILSGIGIGIPVTLLCMILIGGYNPVVQEFLIWTVASALYGVLTGVIFRQNSTLNLPVSIVLHCLGCLLITTGACALCGYADNLLELVLSILPVFLAIYAVIYLLCYRAMKQEEKQINEALNKQS